MRSIFGDSETHFSRRFSGYLFVVLTLVAATASGQHPVSIDGGFSDWDSVPVAFEATGSGSGSSDFQLLKITNDQQFLFLNVELDAEVILQESNSLQLVIDTDANAATGQPIGAVGAELVWNFGSRGGSVHRAGQSVSIRHADIGLRSGPTVSSSRFEIAIRRNASIGGQALFGSPSIRLILRDAASGVQIPGAGQAIEYVFATSAIPVTPTAFDRVALGDLRIMTWNVRNDGLWNSSHAPRFERILASTEPDIISFQEIYGHTASETAALVSSWISPSPSTSWHASGSAGCKTLSRFPILGTWALFGNNRAMLIDASQKIGSHLLLINAHLPCCDNNASRQNQIDQLLAFIRDAKQPGGLLTLEPETPIIITGDLNLVTFSSQLETLLTGQIVNQTIHGPSFSPDWDGGSLTALVSRHSDKRMGHTWRNNLSTYSPGILDYQIYTSSVLETSNHFIVNTEAMSSQRLVANGLLWNDSWASDHLAYVADYRPEASAVASIVARFALHSEWSGESFGGQVNGIDQLKVVAREGEGPKTLGLSNLINSSDGINGLVFDISDLRRPDELSASDFIFQVSPTGAFSSGGNPPSSWASAPAPSVIEVTPGTTDRVVIRWPSGAIRNRWLRVSLLANSKTGLAQPEVFYLGHLLGETTGPTAGFFTVTFADVLPIRALVGQTVDPSSLADIDKNGIVAFADVSAMRSGIGSELTVITIP
jgi:endonuclease/exonuclease/phosphatase family metal-dependent hydrolase